MTDPATTGASSLVLGGLFTSSLGGGVRETARLLEAAHDLGVVHIDTAPAYADSERVLGDALRSVSPAVRESFAVSTKFGGRPQPFDPQDAAGLRASFEESLRLLGRERIDTLFIHEPDRPGQYPWWISADPPAGPVLDVLDGLKSEGRAGAIGVAGTTVTEMTSLVKSGRFDALLTAFNFNVLFREAGPSLLPAAEDRQMRVFIGSVFGQGFLARRHDDEVRAGRPWLDPTRREQLLGLYALSDQSGLTLPELCLRWAVTTRPNDLILVGPKTAEQLQDCVKFVSDGPLPADVTGSLDELAAMLPRRPYEEPMILPLGKEGYFGPGMANLGAAIPVGKLEA